MGQSLDDMMQEAPVLTFEPFAEDKQEVAAEALKAEAVVLTPEEETMVQDFAAVIDLKSSNMILQYGAGAQKKMADFSETALENVRTKDLGEVGKMLADVVGELRDIGAEEEEKGF